MSSSEDKAMGPCGVCGVETKKNCSQCKEVYYCCHDHQKSDWKHHKKQCFPPNSKCTRCGKPAVAGTVCQIPHPQHLLENQGSSFGGDTGQSHTFGCDACQRIFVKSSNDSSQDFKALQITDGPQWCYEGHHTIKPLRATDERRIDNDVIVIEANSQAQSKINALDGNEDVRILKLTSAGFCYDTEDNQLGMAIRLPNLVEIQCNDVDMIRLHLTPELTPKIEKIWMQNPSSSDKPDFDIRCPELLDFSCYYWGPGDEMWVRNMLETATKLQRFDSYKLRVGHLKFASNKLDSIRLHRAELLYRLDLWAPRLTKLDVQAAYDLDEIHFEKDHPTLKSELPTNFTFRQELEVNAMNACLGSQAMKSLQAHPRVIQDIVTDDPDFM